MVANDISTAPTKQPNVLIADDEEPVRSVLITFLTKLGYRTKAVENGYQALQEVQAGDVDLVISDYSMPILNGLELYDRMIQDSPNLADRFILITGTAFTSEVVN
ncbi:MAG: response regulator, partial [Candidatus Omnitrophica bacterium]|nr:response regulator [Candidatus Omnitrophota bacterium]